MTDYLAMHDADAIAACGADARKWADWFCQCAASRGETLPVDFMTTWFASAMVTAQEETARAAERERRVFDHVVGNMQRQIDNYQKRVYLGHDSALTPQDGPAGQTSYCRLCDLEHQLHEDAQGFHHVVKGERADCIATPPAPGAERAAVIEECARIVEHWSLPTIQTASMWLVDQAGIAAEIRALALPRADRGAGGVK